MDNFPTPTPFPDATPIIDFVVPDGTGYGIATDVVQWWQIGTEHGVTTMFQLIIVLVILIGGILLIASQLRGIDD